MIRHFLSRRRRGAMAMVAVVGMVPVTAMMSANLNTSQMVDDRRQVQDASDALARMHGQWTARALNIISMNNVSAAQLLSVAVGSEALFMTTTELTVTAGLAGTHIASHGANHCRVRTSGLAALVEAVVWSAPCAAWHTAVGVPATLAAARAADIVSDFDPVHGIKTAEKALAAIDGMNRSLADRHPRAMAEIAEDYYSLLDIDDHHFADPCDGAGDSSRCDTTNTGDGMALPIKPAEIEAYGQLFAFMERGVTTTFRERGFGHFQGPISHGGGDNHRYLRDHINSITEIGTALYDFKRFYTNRISDLPRHPFEGPGNAQGGSNQQPDEPPDEDTPFSDDTANLLDSLVEILEDVDDITQQVLRVLRNLPLQYDRHPTWANLQGNQSRTNPNSFTRNFRMLHLSVLTPDVRPYIPLGFDFQEGFVFAVPVPQIFQLEEISFLNPANMANLGAVANDPTQLFGALPPVEPATMPEPFHILAFAQKDKSRRLGETVMGSPVTGHTGYGQVGVFNPDLPTLFSQNWHARLMPSTRMDDPRQAGSNLADAAHASFDDLAEDLQQVQSNATWDRVNAH